MGSGNPHNYPWFGSSPARKPTIYAALVETLGREPTHHEIKTEVKRILNEATIDLAERGKLPHQRGRS